MPERTSSMELLLETELIYGRLLQIDEPHLIERYNKALPGLWPARRRRSPASRST